MPVEQDPLAFVQPLVCQGIAPLPPDAGDKGRWAVREMTTGGDTSQLPAFTAQSALTSCRASARRRARAWSETSSTQ